MIIGIPTRTVPAHSSQEVLKPDVAAMEQVFEGFARSGLSDAERGSLTTVEHDLAQVRELRQQLKAYGSLIASGQATPQVFAEAARNQTQLESAQTELQGCLEASEAQAQSRLQQGEGYGPLTMFRSGEDVYVDLRWTSPQVPDQLKSQGVEALSYSLQRPLGQAFFDLCAEPVAAQGPARLTFLRMDVRSDSEEMVFCPADQPLRTSSLAPLGAGGGQLIQHGERPDLEQLTGFQQAFANQVLHDLGMGWPVLAACPQCEH